MLKLMFVQYRISSADINTLKEQHRWYLGNASKKNASGYSFFFIYKMY